MKKILLLIIVLVFPLFVYAKTPNKEETLKVIKNIENTLVGENTKIESTNITNDKIIFKINGIDKEISYKFENNKFSFIGGYYNKETKKIENNEYAFYLYSILESESSIPYDQDNYYNDNKIKELIEKDENNNYIDPSKTFGIDLVKEENKINIIYNYYLDGEYPIIELEDIGDSLVNPATGNYNLLVTIMFIAVITVGVYTCINPRENKQK